MLKFSLRASTAQADALECTAIGILNIIIDTSISSGLDRSGPWHGISAPLRC